MNKSVDAFVGVRSGSQRVKNKNTKPFGDTTLLDLKLETLKQVSNLKNIIVSSDCDNMLSIAKNHGVDTHKRSVYHASNECTNSEYFEMIADVVESENVMYAPVTSPFVSVETFNTCLAKFQTCDSLITTSLVKHHMWMNGSPLNYDISNSPNSQDLPDIHALNYGCALISKQDIKKFKNIVTNTPTFYVLDEIESIDIDTNLDFVFAEYLNKKIGSE